MGGHQPSLPMVLQLRSNGSKGTPASEGLEMHAMRHTSHERAMVPPQYSGYTLSLRIQPDGSPKEDQQRRPSGRQTNAANTSATD